MKRLFFISLLSLSQLGTIAQTNLVPNPSFEIYSSCPVSLNPGNPDEVLKATGWSSTRESPDYFNSCASFSSNVSVPSNACGYQNPSSGNSYCGFQTYFTSGFREFLGTQLTSSTTIGIKYFVTFKVARGFGSIIGANCSTNKIGMLFSTIPYSYTNPAPINNFAHVVTDSLVTDTSNWTTISGSFIADSNYQYINIGNFFDDLNTDTSFIGNSCRAYYYVDDICVSTDSITCLITNIRDHSAAPLALYPNPVQDRFFYINSDQIIKSVEVVDLLGEKADINLTYDKNIYRVFLNEALTGFYFVYIETELNQYLSKILVDP